MTPRPTRRESTTVASGLRALLPFAAGATGRLSAAAALAVGAAAAELVLYYAVYRALALLVVGGPVGDVATRDELARWAAVAAAGVVGRYVLFAIAMFVSHLAAYDVLRRLRMQMAERLARVPLGWFSDRRSGALKKVMVDDVERLELFLAHALPDLAAAAAVGTATTAWLVGRDWRMGLATVVTVPPAFACMAVSLRRSDERVVGYHRSLGAMHAAVVEHVRALPVIKVFNRTADGVASTERAVRDHAREVREMTHRFLPLGTAYHSLVTASVFVVVPVAVALALAGRLGPQDLVFFGVIGLGYGYPIARLYTTWTQLVHLSFGAGLVDEVLDAATIEATGQRAPAPGPAAVTLDEVTFAYDDGPDVLHEVAFTAEPGTVTALVGPSGGGKSTIARLVPRFADPRSGTVRVGGTDVRDLPVDTLMDTVAFVFQDAFLFDDTVEANLRVGRPDATREQLRSAAAAARVLDAIERLPAGWDTVVGARGTHLSGGERQRVALARALLKDAPVVVLDEATAFVDPENEALIQDAITALAAGRTVLMIAHRLSSVVGADQILVVDGGRVVERGAHDDLLAARGRYARLWDDFVAGAGRPLRAPRGPDPMRPADVAPPEATPPPAPAPGAPGEAVAPSGPGAVRRVWTLAGRRRHALVLACACRLLWALVAAVAVWQLALVALDVRAGTLDRWDLARVTAVEAGCFAAQVGLNYATNRLAWIAAFDVGADVRLGLLDHLRRLPMGFHTSRRQGDTLTAATQDIAVVETFAHAPLPTLVGAVAAPLVVVTALVAVDWRLGAVAASSIAVAVPVYRRARRAFTGLAERRQEAQAEATGRVVEYIQGIAVIRAFNLGGDRLAAFRTALDELRAVNTRLAVVILPLAASAMVVVELGVPLVVAAGAHWLAGGTVTAAALVVTLVLVLRVHPPLAQAADQLEMLRIADASLRRVARVLEQPAQPGPAAPGAAPRDATVRLDGVRFGYDPTRPVLDGIDLDIPAGSMCALVGPSGAGKSTLVHLVARFWDPDAGTVRLGGVDVRALTAEQLYAAITVVFQDVYLFPGTIRDNVAFGRPDAPFDDVVDASEAAGLGEVIDALPHGWDTTVGEGGARLSGGERQRVSIARAILKDAPVVLLDEATAALDPTNGRLVQAGLAELTRDRTLVVVAHRLATIRHADQIAVLDEGRIVEHGDHDALHAAGGLYARLWDERRRAARWRIDRP